MTVLQAPIDLSSATRTGPRVYRKQVLRKGTISYPMRDGSRREVTFDDAYLTDLADAYTAGAYDLVPFQLATPENLHNEDPRNYGGRVLGVEKTPEGLDLILELAEDTADLVERTGRRLGVSARIKEALEHVDGRKFPRAIRHVLGTLDPRMTNLAPWEPIDLSRDDDHELIDLSGFHYQQEGATMPRIIDLSTLDPEALEALESFTAANGIDLAAAEVDEDDEPDLGTDEADDDPLGAFADDEDGEDVAEEWVNLQHGDTPEAPDDTDGISDEELEALIDAELETVELSNPGADLSDEETLDLAVGLAGNAHDAGREDRTENARLRFQLASQVLARKGVPPHLIDLAEPILSLTDDEADQLDLSSPATGEAIDVRGIVADMLEAVAGTIDLSSETGYGHETEPDEQVQTLASAWTEYLNEN